MGGDAVRLSDIAMKLLVWLQPPIGVQSHDKARA